MGCYIMKLTHGSQEYYLEWSSITDSPVTFGVSLEDFRVLYNDTSDYGRRGELDWRLERVNRYGTSAFDGTTPVQLIQGNRAGPDEQCLSMEEIIQAYCLMLPIRGYECTSEGWKEVSNALL